jgi:uncharacterized protein YndB with AHSA1/START domain
VSKLREWSQTKRPAPRWRPGCKLLFVMSRAIASRQSEPESRTATHSHWAARESRADPATVNIEVSLAGDTRRIFEALTVPEYMELWMSMPGHHPVCHSRASRLADGFVIDHLCDSRPPIRIAGTYLMCLRRKLIFRWSVHGPWISPVTFADIRLSGEFENSLLRLRHSGFASRDDYSWHAEFWKSSLTRLSRLLSGVSGAS